MILLSAVVRLWMLGNKGLGYDEATTALMSRAPLGEILWYHWQAAFEHPPVWVLSMKLWSAAFGQSEAALRLLPAIAGILTVPLLWQALRVSGQVDRRVRLLAVGLAAISPLLILYSQDARMYSVATLLAVASVYMGMRLVARPRLATIAGFVLVNWAMVGFHYYFVLLVGVEAIFFVIATRADRARVGKVVLSLVLSVLPLALWAGLAPGFGVTLDTVLAGAGEPGTRWVVSFGRIWRDLTFGAIRWQPPRAAWGYLVLPFFLIGIYDMWGHRGSSKDMASVARPIAWNRFFVLVVIVPVLVSLFVSAGILTRYILFISPFFWVIVATGIIGLGGRVPALEVVGLVVVGVVCIAGLGYYFTSYQKSAYRDMVTYLTSRAGAEDAILLEAPRQHLLAKYYLPRGRQVYPVPIVVLPDYWPVTAPPVVPDQVDDQLRQIMDSHSDAWLILAGEDEVDRGEFVAQYLRAVSYQQDCQDWFNLRLCHFVAPSSVSPICSTPLDVTFGDEMRLAREEMSLAPRDKDGHQLLAALSWETMEKPKTDYKVTLRLISSDGTNVSQVDDLPVGSLLPPTVWSADDAKLGYMVLPLPQNLAPGQYDIALGLYDPASPGLVPFAESPLRRTGSLTDTSGLFRLGTVQIGADTEAVIRPQVRCSDAVNR